MLWARKDKNMFQIHFRSLLEFLRIFIPRTQYQGTGSAINLLKQFHKTLVLRVWLGKKVYRFILSKAQFYDVEFLEKIYSFWLPTSQNWLFQLFYKFGQSSYNSLSNFVVKSIRNVLLFSERLFCLENLSQKSFHYWHCHAWFWLDFYCRALFL